MEKHVIYRGWEYERQGDYHRNLDPNWSYTPTYLLKMHHIRKLINNEGKGASILDAGCGEGVLVEEFSSKGYSIRGIDLNYESNVVTRGSILDLPYDDESFDIVLLLDVFEHLAFCEQTLALKEIHRVLIRGGLFVASIPNMAHLNSRFRFFFRGHLDRTDIETNHLGERPFKENERLIRSAGFDIEQIRGITLTVPILYRQVICRNPSSFLWLHNLLQLFALPSFTMLDIFLSKKR